MGVPFLENFGILLIMANGNEHIFERITHKGFKIYSLKTLKPKHID